MKRISIFLALVILVFYIGESCKKCTSLSTSHNPCDSVNHKFTDGILPLITASCATSVGCHAAGSVNSGGPLTNYNEIFAKAAIIQTQVNSGNMPPPPAELSDEQKKQINCWVDAGAPND